MAILKYSSKKDQVESEEGLEEWDCPTCGFHVQLGTECIYCGEKKVAE